MEILLAHTLNSPSSKNFFSCQHSQCKIIFWPKFLKVSAAVCCYAMMTLLLGPIFARHLKFKSYMLKSIFSNHGFLPNVWKYTKEFIEKKCTRRVSAFVKRVTVSVSIDTKGSFLKNFLLSDC